MLEIRNLTKRFGDFEAVKDVSISVPDGAFLVLLGPSGCGKTTLLRMLAGLELPTAGQIVFDGQTVSDGDRGWTVDPAKRNSGLVFQSYALWPHMSVRGNVEWPLKVMNMPRAQRAERVAEVLTLLDIAALADRYPNEISGGQQQRVAIARTIAPKPGVLLFDEPLSNLDAKLRVEMRTELMRLHRATGATTVYVTHDQIEAMTMASHVAVMNQGRVQQFGTPADLVDHPETAFVATFVGTPANNMVPVVKNGSGYRVGGRHMPLTPPADECLAMYRAEKMTLSDNEGERTLPMELVETSAIAGRVMITGLSEGLRLTAIMDTLPNAQIGDTVQFCLPAEPDGWFDPDGERIG
ncbi:ABC transporter ATP-binding protein [Aliiroseovarius sp. Z3]|uniref:ABC transporter ATP-binding protein n=1 Tax=Aliiroseovarius sp. Z3 TaxID=2811402 RepID=UPI0023B2A0E6|nr:ABC transporter ATP-binding protein [Aliiroseovarius sp. Z3]MDE9451886.1 ABC transporter ATP-binding protein [Aliiroseovarius sp. Z3]MDE9452044.1 ABC transporter ATP-binding protein [Aliiroseovarius sp. Z3]